MSLGDPHRAHQNTKGRHAGASLTGRCYLTYSKQWDERTAVPLRRAAFMNIQTTLPTSAIHRSNVAATWAALLLCAETLSAQSAPSTSGVAEGLVNQVEVEVVHLQPP